MNGFHLEESSGFSILRADGFAPGHVHGFVVRGRERAVLFRPGPVLREEICRSAGIEGATLHLARQVHGARAIEAPARAAAPEADALIVRAPGHAAAVATADCVPVLLASPGGACAAVHAGWRGLLAGVVEAALAALSDSRTSSARDEPRREAGGGAIEAAVGPAIGPCCFEVGGDIAERFLVRFPRDGGCLRPAPMPGKSFIDLPRAVLLALEEAGVPRERVHLLRACTRCAGDRYESYRRDGPAAGRMISFTAPRSGHGHSGGL